MKAYNYLFACLLVASLIILVIYCLSLANQQTDSKKVVFLIINYSKTDKVKHWWIVPKRYNGCGVNIEPYINEDGASFTTKEGENIELSPSEKVLSIKTTYTKLPELKRKYLKQ